VSPTFCLAKGFGGDQLGLKWVMEVDGLRETGEFCMVGLGSSLAMD